MYKIKTVSLLIILLSSLNASIALADGQWRFPVGLSHSNSIDEIGDINKDNLEAEGAIVIDQDNGLGVGVTFSPYYFFDFGLGIGLNMGPVALIAIETSQNDLDFIYTDMPVGFDLRYMYVHKASGVSPYVRTGFRYHIANGDYVVDQSVGLTYGIGIEFRIHRKIALGIEYLVDNSEVKFQDIQNGGTTSLKPTENLVTFNVVF